jgi:hypothetical protein
VIVPRAKRIRLRKLSEHRLLGDQCPHCDGKGRLPAKGTRWSVRWNYQDGSEWSGKTWASREEVEAYLARCELMSVQVEVYSPDGFLYVIDS